jgi:hypothetical protein
MANILLKNILDDEFLETLAKSADLYKIGSNSVLDPEEIRIGLKVVPRAVMSMLISELAPMPINANKDIQLPFGKVAFIRVNKNAADDFTGSVYSDNKLVYDFKNRSIPGLGIILLSTFELYDMQELSKPHKESEDVDRKIQKLIDERMELHSLVNRVVEDKMAQREAIHKIMMAKLNEALKAPPVPLPSATIPSIPSEPLEVKAEDIAKKELEKAKQEQPKKILGSSHAGVDVRLKDFGSDKREAVKRMMVQEKIKPNLPKSEEMDKSEGGWDPEYGKENPKPLKSHAKMMEMSPD